MVPTKILSTLWRLTDVTIVLSIYLIFWETSKKSIPINSRQDIYIGTYRSDTNNICLPSVNCQYFITLFPITGILGRFCRSVDSFLVVVLLSINITSWAKIPHSIYMVSYNQKILFHIYEIRFILMILILK